MKKPINITHRALKQLISETINDFTSAVSWDEVTPVKADTCVDPNATATAPLNTRVPSSLPELQSAISLKLQSADSETLEQVWNAVCGTLDSTTLNPGSEPDVVKDSVHDVDILRRADAYDQETRDNPIRNEVRRVLKKILAESESSVGLGGIQGGELDDEQKKLRDYVLAKVPLKDVLESEPGGISGIKTISGAKRINDLAIAKAEVINRAMSQAAKGVGTESPEVSKKAQEFVSGWNRLIDDLENKFSGKNFDPDAIDTSPQDYDDALEAFMIQEIGTRAANKDMINVSSDGTPSLEGDESSYTFTKDEFDQLVNKKGPTYNRFTAFVAEKKKHDKEFEKKIRLLAQILGSSSKLLPDLDPELAELQNFLGGIKLSNDPDVLTIERTREGLRTTMGSDVRTWSPSAFDQFMEYLDPQVVQRIAVISGDGSESFDSVDEFLRASGAR